MRDLNAVTKVMRKIHHEAFEMKEGMKEPELEYQGQFRISSDLQSLKPGAIRHHLGRIVIDTFEGAEITEAYDQTNRLVGLFVGTLIDTERGVVKGRVVFDGAVSQAGDIDRFIEDQVYRFSGTFLFVLSLLGERRIYLDANGTKSVLYDPLKKVAGATTSLLLSLDEYEARFQRDLYSACGVDGDGWFTGGLTAHEGIQRLLCNHYLDLNSWKAVRHWPNPGELTIEATDYAAQIETIVEHVKRTLRVLSNDRKISVALTAGNETRLLLACCRELVKKVNFVTVAAPGLPLEVLRATQLAARFGLQHEILPYVKANGSQVELWERRTSHCISGTNKTMHPSVAPLDGRIFIGGFGGEIGRGFLWLGSKRSDNISAVEIVDRLKLPRHPVVLAAVREWLIPIDHYDALTKLDLAYMELRMSCWGFADSYALPRQLEIHPLVSRRVYAAMLALPADLRRNNGMTGACIKREWPELLSLPINRYGDFRDRIAPIHRVIANPRRAVRKIRQVSLVAYERALARLT